MNKSSQKWIPVLLVIVSMACFMSLLGIYLQSNLNYQVAAAFFASTRSVGTLLKSVIFGFCIGVLSLFLAISFFLPALKKPRFLLTTILAALHLGNIIVFIISIPSPSHEYFFRQDIPLSIFFVSLLVLWRFSEKTTLPPEDDTRRALVILLPLTVGFHLVLLFISSIEFKQKPVGAWILVKQESTCLNVGQIYFAIREGVVVLKADSPESADRTYVFIDDWNEKNLSVFTPLSLSLSHFPDESVAKDVFRARIEVQRKTKYIEVDDEDLSCFRNSAAATKVKCYGLKGNVLYSVEVENAKVFFRNTLNSYFDSFRCKTFIR